MKKLLFLLGLVPSLLFGAAYDTRINQFNAGGVSTTVNITPAASSLLGYNSSKGLVNITLGTNLSITGTTLNASGGGGGGSPGGSDTQVQFNDSGSFGGDAGFTFIKGTGAAAISGTLTLGSGSTVISDAAGKILSAALNTVAVGQGGTGLTAGTSGGIPYFSSTSALASSGVLAANALVIGGGAGTTPATTTTGTGVLTALGVNVGSAGAFVTFNGAGGTPSSMTGTNITGTAAGLTAGNATLAASATTLATPRAIYGNNFDGSAALTQIIASTYGGTGNGFVKFSGPAASEKTFTLPNASATILTDNAAVTVAQGGTGITSGTSGGVPYFSASGTIASSAALAANAIVIGGGAGTTPATTTTGTGVITAIGNAVNTTGGFDTINGTATLTNKTITDGVNTVSTPGTTSIGYLGMPQNSQSTAYTTVMGDAGKHILHPTADNNARTFTIDSNANVAYPIGTVITVVNQINTVTIAITSDTLTWFAGSGTASTGSRTLSAGGVATLLKVSATGWIISGPGVS